MKMQMLASTLLSSVILLSSMSVCAEPARDKGASDSKAALSEFEPDKLAQQNHEAISAYKEQNYDKASEIMEKVLEGLEQEKVSELSQAEVLANYSIILKKAGKQKEADENLELARAIRVKYHMPPVDLALVDILPTLAVRKQGTEMVKETADILEAKDPLFPPGTIKDLTPEGWSQAMAAALEQKKAKDTKAEFVSLRKALTIANTFPKPNDKVIATMNLLADLYRHMGRPYSARMLFLQCVAEHEKLGKADTADYATLLDHAAQTMLLLHENAEAEKLLERAVTIYKKVLGADSADLAMAMCTLGELYLQQKEEGKGEKTLADAIAMMKRTLKPDDLRILIAEDFLATYYSRNGKLKEAEALQTSVVSGMEKKYTKANPDFALAINNLAQTMYRQQKYTEAEPLFKRCIQMNTELYGARHPKTMHSIGAYASFLEKTGKKAEADKLFKQLTAQ